MNNRNFFQSVSIVSAALLLFILASCGEAPETFSTNDLYGSDAGGSGTTTTFLMEDGGTTNYLTFETGKGERGTVADNTYTVSEDFTWDITEDGIITITYWNEPDDRVWANRTEATETLTAVFSEAGVLTIEDSENKVYEADTDNERDLFMVISSYIDGRTYADSTGSEKLTFGSTGGNFDGVNFEWELSASKMKIYLVHDDDDNYDIIKWSHSSGYSVIDENGIEYEWTEKPIYIEDEDITKENLIGTWISDDGEDTASFTSSNYGTTGSWYIEDSRLYVLITTGSFIEFSFDFSESEKEVRISGSGETRYYTSTNANIQSIYEAK